MSASEYQGVVGVVEVTGYESFKLWEEFHKNRGVSWEEQRSGPLITVGKLDKRPVCIAPLVHTVNGKKIMFLEATSVLVDWNMIEKWLRINLPESAFNGTQLNKVDPINFASLIY